MLDRLSESLRHEQRFSAEISHELRTPLAAIIAETELALRRDRGPGEYRSALAEVHARAQQLQRIVESLLATARAEADAHGERCDPVAVVEAMLADARGAGPETRLEIVRPDRTGTVVATPDTVERILAPLLENARAHATAAVEVRIERDGDRVVVTVTDDGPGVAAAESERIFDPGYRAGGSGDGTGLGLPLARRLARTIGGEVGCSPAPGPGGRFFAALPAG